MEPGLGEEALQVGASQVHHRIELLMVDSPPPALREGAAKGEKKQSELLSTSQPLKKVYMVLIEEGKHRPVRLHLREPVLVAVGSDVGGGLLVERIL